TREKIEQLEHEIVEQSRDGEYQAEQKWSNQPTRICNDCFKRQAHSIHDKLLAAFDPERTLRPGLKLPELTCHANQKVADRRIAAVSVTTLATK
ncbi:MAG: hypothetical protein JO283_15850, partial [Bradyrhizobium sp.]|nr:hypothetical protein [Bradyrhizobium sp.]